MSKVKIDLHDEGIQELLKSAEIAAVCEKEANKVQSSAISMSGGEYGVRKAEMKTRVGYNVYPNSKEAAKDNYQNNTLLNCIGKA